MLGFAQIDDAGSPFRASPLRFAIPASLGYRPEPSWLGRSPGQQSTGVLPLSGSPCFARKSRALDGATIHWIVATAPSRPRSARHPRRFGTTPCLIVDLSKGVSVILVEQNAELALELARYGYVLETGTIALEGEANGLMDNEHVRKAYLGI